jgi:hypothetical protein
MYDLSDNFPLYSLCDRVHGSLLGMVLGSLLPYCIDPSFRAPTPGLAPGIAVNPNVPPPEGNGDGSARNRYTDYSWFRGWLDGVLTPRLSGSSSCEVPLGSESEEFAAFTIATIPLAMLYHEDLEHLQQQLHHRLLPQMLKVLSDSPRLNGAPEQVHQNVQSLCILAGAIALNLRGVPASRMYGTLRDTSLDTSKDTVDSSSIWQTLLPLITQDYSHNLLQFSQVINQFQATHPGMTLTSWELAIAEAFWAFCSTPEYPHLSLARAWRMAPQNTLTWTLTGALSGSYNGLSGLPRPWRQRLFTGEAGQLLQKIWQIEGQADVLDMGDRLWATWAGVYQNESQDNLDLPTPAWFVVLDPRNLIQNPKSKI